MYLEECVWKGVHWFYLAEDLDKLGLLWTRLWSFVYWNARNFLIHGAAVSFSRRTLLHWVSQSVISLLRHQLRITSTVHYMQLETFVNGRQGEKLIRFLHQSVSSLLDSWIQGEAVMSVHITMPSQMGVACVGWNVQNLTWLWWLNTKFMHIHSRRPVLSFIFVTVTWHHSVQSNSFTSVIRPKLMSL
jgi:hypothetical protein